MSGSSAHSYWSHSSICMHILTTVLMMCDGDGGFATYFKNLQSIAQSTRTMHHFFFFFIFFFIFEQHGMKIDLQKKTLISMPTHWKNQHKTSTIYRFPLGVIKSTRQFPVARRPAQREAEFNGMKDDWRSAPTNPCDGEGCQQILKRRRPSTAVHEIEKAVNRFMIITEKAGNRYMRWNRPATES